MKTNLLKRLLFAVTVLAVATINSQTVTFSTGLEGWDANFGSNGTVTHAPTEGVGSDGALKLERSTNNANFGIKPVTGIDATAKKGIRVRFKNETKGVQFRVSGTNGDGVTIKDNSGGNIDFSIETESDEYVTLYIDMSSYTLWTGTLTNFWIGIRQNTPDDSGDAFYLDEIEFLDTVPPTTYSEFIQNPSFDGPSGISHITGSATFANKGITSTEFHDGIQSLRFVFSADADAPYWNFTTYEKTYGFGNDFPVNSDIQIKMWVKTNRTTPISIATRVKLTDDGVDTATKPIANVTTTNTAMGWEELTFDLQNAEKFDGIQFWFALNWTDLDPANLLNGDIVYFDQMTASITPATLSNKENTLEDVVVYPNPVNNELNIKSPFGSDIVIYNVLGAVVKSINKSEALEKVSLSNLTSGL